MDARFSRMVGMLGVCTFACAEHLATLPPSDHYRFTDLGVAKLNGDQRAFIDRAW
jgi:hypothetical protein